jgi:hypothetical protein
MATLEKIAPAIAIDIIAVAVTKLKEWLNAGKIDAVICARSALSP